MERIGEYELLRLIGEGGMGKVFEAEERLSKRHVAVKLLRPELSQSDAAREMFQNEMGILAQLDHPNLVRLFACAEVDGRLLMALELLEGRTLRDVLSDGALPWTTAVTIAAQIASGLGAAHALTPSVVHRDLKPENVMVLGDGSIKIMDFGVAKVLQALRKNTTHSVGTLQYMSPEQIDAGEIGPRADLYCLGLILYEMLSGKPPFESASPRELLNLQCTSAPPALPDEVRRTLPKGIEQLMLALLEKSAERRPESALAVSRVLEPFVPSGASTSSDSAAKSSEQSSKTEVVTPVPSERPGVQAHDTIALVDRATAPRDVSRRTAAWVLIASALVASAVTYAVRAHSRAEPDETSEIDEFSENAP